MSMNNSFFDKEEPGIQIAFLLSDGSYALLEHDSVSGVWNCCLYDSSFRLYESGFVDSPSASAKEVMDSVLRGLIKEPTFSPLSETETKHLQARIDEAYEAAYGSKEKILFRLAGDGGYYLLLQKEAGGYRYTLYNEEDVSVITFGFVDAAMMEDAPQMSPVSAARHVVFDLEGISPTHVIKADLAILRAS